MFLIEVNSEPTMVEDKFVKMIHVNGQWENITEDTAFEPGAKVKVLSMPSLDLIESTIHFHGNISLNLNK